MQAHGQALRRSPKNSILCPILVLGMQERSGQTGQSQKEHHEGMDNRDSEEKLKGFFPGGKKNPQWRLHQTIQVLKNAQKEDKGSFFHKDPHGEYQGDKLHQERDHFDIRNNFF